MNDEEKQLLSCMTIFILMIICILLSILTFGKIERINNNECNIETRME